jgi:hypothetical protein
MFVNVILSPNTTSNRVRGNYLLGLNEKVVGLNKQIEIVINNFSYNGFDINKICILDISDGILNPPRSYGLLGILYHKIFFNRRKIAYLRKFDGVVCACDAQYQVLKKFVSNVYIVPDLSHYHHRYERKDALQVNSILKFVWDGQSVNFPQVKLFIEKNLAILSKPDVSLYIITDEFMPGNKFSIKRYIETLKCNVHFVKWELNSFIDNVKNCDVGIAIVDMKCNNSLLKPENKLVNYVGLGLTAIASNTMAYSAFAKNCPNSVIICNANNDWIEAIEFMRANRDKLNKFGEQGREYVIENYSERKLIDSWISVISNFLTSKC